MRSRWKSAMRAANRPLTGAAKRRTRLVQGVTLGIIGLGLFLALTTREIRLEDLNLPPRRREELRALMAVAEPLVKKYGGNPRAFELAVGAVFMDSGKIASELAAALVKAEDRKVLLTEKAEQTILDHLVRSMLTVVAKHAGLRENDLPAFETELLGGDARPGALTARFMPWLRPGFFVEALRLVEAASPVVLAHGGDPTKFLAAYLLLVASRAEELLALEPALGGQGPEREAARAELEKLRFLHLRQAAGQAGIPERGLKGFERDVRERVPGVVPE